MPMSIESPIVEKQKIEPHPEVYTHSHFIIYHNPLADHWVLLDVPKKSILRFNTPQEAAKGAAQDCAEVPSDIHQWKLASK